MNKDRRKEGRAPHAYKLKQLMRKKEEIVSKTKKNKVKNNMLCDIDSITSLSPQICEIVGS